MSGYFPTLSELRPHLSDPVLSGVAPASPSSTSVSDGSGLDEFEVPQQSLLGPSRASGRWAPKRPYDEGDAHLRTREFDEETESGAREPRSAADVLPYEIWVHIFKFLPSTRDLKTCLIVSHLWCQVGVELLWHKPSIYRLATLEKLLAVIDPPREPSYPSTADPPASSDSASPRATFDYALFIRRLNLMNIAELIDDKTLFRLRKCARLERLALQGCTTLTDNSLAPVLGNGNMPELVAIDLTNVKLLTDATVTAIASGCPRLQGLNLTGCSLVTDGSIVKVAESCHLLRRIKLVRCNLKTNMSLIALARSCPLLLEVDLVDVPGVTSAGVRELWLHSSNLRELRLSNCSQVSNMGFPYLFPPSNRKSMQSTFNHTRPLFPPVSLLQVESGKSTPTSSAYSSPELSSADMLPSTPSSTVLPPPNWMRSFDHLRILDLTSCVLLTDQAVDAIVTNAPRIRQLTLAKCSELTDESVNSICRLGRSLHQLHMGHVSNITDAAVSRLARSCTRLRYIDFACCPLLSDSSVLELSQLPKLRRIGLVRVTNLTDLAIHALVERPSSLERIHLSYCENISVEAIHYLLQRLRNLTHLSLTGVPAFRREDLQQFCRQPPKDFNVHQRQAFCVYSGNGVRELRQYLASIFDVSQRSECCASSPTSSVSISFDQEGDEPPALDLESPVARHALPPGSFPSAGPSMQGDGSSAAEYPATRAHLAATAEPVFAANDGTPAPSDEHRSSFGSRLLRLGRGYTS